MSTTVNLRNLPEDLIREVKSLAALEGISLKQFFMLAVKERVSWKSTLTKAEKGIRK